MLIDELYVDFLKDLTKLLKEHEVDVMSGIDVHSLALSLVNQITIYHCIKFPEDFGINESLDGDHQSALASAGFGTDEDYGSFGGTDE